MGIWDSITDQIDRLEQKRLNWVEGRVDFDEERVQAIIENAQGESVYRERLLQLMDASTAPINLLDQGEQPHYILNGSTIDVEGQGAGTENILGWDRDRRIGGIYTVVTEDRVLVIANHARGYDEHSIPFDAITTVNLNTGFTSTRLSIQTRSATYHCGVSKTKRKYSIEEVNDAVEYLRRKREQNPKGSASDDSLDRLQKLKSLLDDGAITEDEFNEKKSKILDEI